MAARPRPTALVIGVLALAGLCASVTSSLLAPLLPQLPRITGASAEDASWLVTATVLSAAIATPTTSRLADMYGKRRMVLVVLALMAAGSIVGVVGESLPVLVAARALQGTAIALVPIGISIMRDELPRERLAAGVALMSATIGIGLAAGIPLSAFTYAHLGWDALFWGTAILAVSMIAAVALVVPESPVRSGGRFDAPGAVLLSLALLGLLLGITKGGHWGWSGPQTLLSFGAGLVLFAGWLPYQWRVADPLVDLRTTRQRPLLLVNAAGFLVGFSFYSNTLSSSELLQLPTSTGYGLGLPIATAGLLMLPPALTMAVVAPGSATSLGSSAPGPPWSSARCSSCSASPCASCSWRRPGRSSSARSSSASAAPWPTRPCR
ncbi:MAG: MFS transporter [Candidatus Nanopelagicales bacterium]